MKMPELEIGIEIRRADGTVEEYSEPGHSWTRNAWNFLFSAMFDGVGDGSTSQHGAGYMTGLRFISEEYYSLGDRTVSNNSTSSDYDIYVGTGTTAFDPDSRDFTRISDGTSAGRLTHGTMTQNDAGSYNYSSKIWTTVWSREFTNSSGADITINEIAIEATVGLFTSFSTAGVMFIRDKLDTGITVGHSESVTFAYRFRMDFNGTGNDGWTRNAWNWAYAIMSRCKGDGSGEFGEGRMSSRQTSGTINSTAGLVRRYGTSDNRGYAVAATGVFVGTGDTPETPEDYALEAVISSGTSAGQLTHGISSLGTISYNASTKVWTGKQVREFTNSSGSDITVNEVGLIYRPGSFFTSSTDFLFYRKVLDSPVTIANGNSHTFEVAVNMDFTEIDT